MATSNVSAIDREEWQLIESKSATSTSVTFNAFSGYKHLWLTGKAITKSGSDGISIRPNNNSTQGNYVAGADDGNDTKFRVAAHASASQAMSFKIYDVDKTTPKQVSCSYSYVVPQNEHDAFVDPVAVTSLVVFTNGGSVTFTGGTFYLYGIVA
jgi:hypothetical protein